MTDVMPEKIDLTTTRLSDEKLAQLRQLIPEAFSDGSIDFDALRRSLGDAVDTSPKEERFGLRWPGKSKLQQVINQPSVGTLVPQPEESVDWDTTQISSSRVTTSKSSSCFRRVTPGRSR